MRAGHLGGLAAAAVLTGLSLFVVLRGHEDGPTLRSSPAYSPTRTPWGDPDLQGSFTNHQELLTPIERPDEFEGRRLSQIGDAELARVNGERRRRWAADMPTWEPSYEAQIGSGRAWLVVDPADGKIPPLTPDAMRRAAARGAAWRARAAEAPWHGRDLFERCITRGLPASMMPLTDADYFDIVQSPGLVTIRYEKVHEARVIPLDGRPHVGSAIRLYMGDARGRFEGNTLVVETTNFTDETSYRGSSRDLILTERFTPVAPDRLEWSATFDDAATWIAPWTMAMDLRRTEAGVLEYACHEGNHGLRNIFTAALGGS